MGLGYTDMVPLPPRFDPLPREITMNVYNTTFREGLASTVAKEFKQRGFKVKEVTNDPLKTLQMGTALIRYGEEGDLAAKIVAQHVPEGHAPQGRPRRHEGRRGDRQRLHRARAPGRGPRTGTPAQAGGAHRRAPLRVAGSVQGAGPSFGVPAEGGHDGAP